MIVGEKGELDCGKDFRCNSNCIINCNKHITFGDDCLLAWGITCLDSDGHDVINKEDFHVINKPKDIKVGDHVWICPGVSLLKGSEVGDNSIVASSSVITRHYLHATNSIISGSKVLKENIDWKD